MAISNFAIPDFEGLSVDDRDVAQEVTKTTDLSEGTPGDIYEEITSESDTTEEYSSSDDDMKDSTEMSNDSIEVNIGDDTECNSVDQPVCTGVGIDTEYSQYNLDIPTEVDFENQITFQHENPTMLNDHEFQGFTNLPNLPTEGLFGVALTNDASVSEAEETNSASQTEPFTSTNLPNLTEIHSDKTNDSANGAESASQRNSVFFYNKDYMPKLEAITESFESVFTIGSSERRYSGSDRQRHNKRKLKKRK